MKRLLLSIEFDRLLITTDVVDVLPLLNTGPICSPDSRRSYISFAWFSNVDDPS